MDTFKLTQIAVFNPHRLDDKTAKALFVVRTKLFQYLINELSEETKNCIAQNHLIIAARGMGKTSLLKRIQIEIKEGELAKNFIPILYQEEQYNIANLNDLWLNSLDKLADFIESLGNEDLVIKIDKKVDELKGIKNDVDINIYTTFMDFCTKLNKRPILLLDNISLLFSRLDKDEQHTLRKLLIEKKAPILIAANPTKVEEVLEYGAPFYDAFQIHYIDKLTDEELFIVLNNLIKLTKSEELTVSLQQNKARIKVINKLTGGNPRTAVMLFKLIVKGFSENLKDDLDALLDEVTPLYKARFEEELPKQAQIIMNAIANHWHPINLKELGRITNLPNNKLQPQLNRLLKAGWIEKNKPKGKNTLYEINERFFNFWYLMRQSNRRDKKQITYLSYFLESLYTSEILQTNAKLLLNRKATNADQILSQLAISQSVTPKLKRQLISNAKEDIAQITDRKEKQRLTKLIKELEQSNKIRSIPSFLHLNKAIVFEKNGEYVLAEKNYKKALEINPKSENTWNRLGALYHNHLHKYKEAERAYNKAVEINPKFDYAWSNLGRIYQYFLYNYRKAENAYKRVVEINPKFDYTWNNLGYLYQNNLNMYKEAEKMFKKSLEINPKSENTWNSLGNLYQDCFKKYEEAEKTYNKALEIDPNLQSPKFNLVFLLRDKLDKIEEAKELFYTIKDYKSVKDSYYLNLSLFALYDKKEEGAKLTIIKALSEINDRLPFDTQDDWWRYAAIINRLSHTEWFLEILKNNDFDIVLAPYYEAIKTFTLKENEIDSYLSTKALEIREAAYLVIDKIKQYM